MCGCALFLTCHLRGTGRSAAGGGGLVEEGRDQQGRGFCRCARSPIRAACPRPRSLLGWPTGPLKFDGKRRRARIDAKLDRVFPE